MFISRVESIKIHRLRLYLSSLVSNENGTYVVPNVINNRCTMLRPNVILTLESLVFTNVGLQLKIF